MHYPQDYVPPEFFLDDGNYVAIDEYSNLKKWKDSPNEVRHWFVAIEEVCQYNPLPDDVPQLDYNFIYTFYVGTNVGRERIVIVASNNEIPLPRRLAVQTIFERLKTPWKRRWAPKAVVAWLISVINADIVCYKTTTGKWLCYNSDDMKTLEKYARIVWRETIAVLKRKVEEVERLLKVVDERIFCKIVDLKEYDINYASIEEVAALYGTDAALAYTIAKHLARISIADIILAKRKDLSEMKERIAEYVGARMEEGVSINRIAEEIGMPVATLYRWSIIEKKRKKRSGYKWTSEEERLRIAKMYWCEKKKIVEIAKITGRSVGTISRIINRYRGKIKCDPSQ